MIVNGDGCHHAKKARLTVSDTEKQVKKVFPGARAIQPIWGAKWTILRICPMNDDMAIGHGRAKEDAWQMAYDSLCQVMEGFEDD